MKINFSLNKLIAEKAKTFSFLFTMTLLLTVFPLLVAGQAASGVTGVVTDSTGALIPGANVTIFDTKTSAERTTTTNDQGTYIFNNVQAGEGFRLTFTVDGFQTYVINNVSLGIGKVETQNAKLTIGQVGETVEVVSTSGDATLNTSDASIGNVIGRRQLRELPIQIRGSPAALIGLQPGAIGNGVGAGGGNRTGSVTGSRADQGNITVDGIDANNPLTQQAFVTVANAPIDSVQEFRAVTSGPNSSDGRSSGGQIQLTTNSGTNDYHGSLREYYRNENTAANSFFNNRNGVERPALRRHQFGGSIGGPLPFFNFGEGGPVFRSGRDKLFFFFDFEGRRDRSEVSVSRTVPLQNLREGRIGYINNNAGCLFTSRRDTTPGCISEFTVAQIMALDPQGVGVNPALLALINNRYPQANDLTGGDGINTGLFRFNAPNIRNDKIYTTRVDANPTQSQRLFTRFTITRRDSTNSTQLFPGDEDSVSLLDESFAIAGGHTWVINPSVTNVITAGLSKLNFIFASPTNEPSFPNSFSAGGILPTSPFPGLSDQTQIAYTPTFRDDVTYTRGAHTFQFGVSYKPIRQNTGLVNDFNFVALGLGGGLTQLNAATRPTNLLASNTARSRFDNAFAFLLGRISNITTNFNYDNQGNALPRGSGNFRSYQYNEYEAYVQDNWRVRSDLTLNLGVRYHLYPAPYERNGAQSANDIDFDTLFAIRQQNAAAGIAGVGSEPLLSFNLAGKGNDAAPYYETDKTLFAPRLGFAYRPSFENGFLGKLFGGKSVIRGNASKVYDRVGGAVTFLLNQNSYIFDNRAGTNFGTTNVTSSLLNGPRFTSLGSIPNVNPAPVVTTPFTPNVDATGFPTGLADGLNTYTIEKNFKIPYSYTYSLGMQREIPGNMLLEVNYVGRLGRRLFTQADANQVLNFRDAGSGQFYFDALNAIQAQLQSGVAPDAVTNQPFIENQFNAALGAGTCDAGFSCTQFLAANFTDLITIGDASDLTQALAFNGFFRPNVGMSAQFATNRVVTNVGKSSYNGLLVSLQKRLSQGFEFEVNYTYSHSIDNNSSIANTVSGGLVCDVLNLNSCRGDSDFDIRHLFNANYIIDVPIGRGRAFGGNMNKFLDAIIGGFSLSGIVNARSGLAISSSTGSYPVSYLVNSAALLNGTNADFSSNIREEGGGIQFFTDPDAVQDALRYPRHGESGGRNIFRSPSFVSFDMGLSKKFRMPWSESHLLSLRVDAFNVFNQNSFSVPNLGFGSSTFGRITSSLSDPRELQFAVRYDF